MRWKRCGDTTVWRRDVARYIPTAAEVPWGGYEVLHAHRVYGQLHMVSALPHPRTLAPSHWHTKSMTTHCSWISTNLSRRSCARRTNCSRWPIWPHSKWASSLLTSLSSSTHLLIFFSCSKSFNVLRRNPMDNWWQTCTRIIATNFSPMSCRWPARPTMVGTRSDVVSRRCGLLIRTTPSLVFRRHTTPTIASALTMASYTTCVPTHPCSPSLALTPRTHPLR